MSKFRTLEGFIRDVMTGQSKTGNKTVLENAIRTIMEKPEDIETDQNDQITVGSYVTKNFEVCPVAQKLYTSLKDNKKVDVNEAEKAAIQLDKLFALEKSVVAKDAATPEDVKTAEDLEKKAMHHATKAGLDQDFGFVGAHVEVIKKKVTNMDRVVDAKDYSHKDEVVKRFKTFDKRNNPDPKGTDFDTDNSKFAITRNLKAQRKVKIIDGD